MVKHIIPVCNLEQCAEVMAEQHRRDTVFDKAANEMAPKLELDAGEVRQALVVIWCRYNDRIIVTEGIEEGPKAKDDLWSLAAKAEEMASVIRRLGQYAVEAMNDQTMPQELIQAAEPFNLPDLDPYRTMFIHDDSDPRNQADYEKWKLGGLWVIRLESIAKLARLQADLIAKQIANGGRKSLADRVYGKPDDWLIEACMEFAEAHGCQVQATVLKMVQAIQDVERRPKTGRKAVRNVAQTKRI
jgi:hypothetical protein